MISEKILNPKFILTWHDLDADRVERSEYVNKRGTDHAGVTNALALAQVVAAAAVAVALALAVAVAVAEQ